MSIVSTDQIIPRYCSSVKISDFKINGGSVLDRYLSIPYTSLATGPFTDATTDNTEAITGVLNIMGDQVTLILDPYTFTPTVDDTEPAPLTLSTPIAGSYAPYLDSGVSNVFMASSAGFTIGMVSVGMNGGGDGDIEYTPQYPITTGGFSTSDGAVNLPGVSLSWRLY